MNSQLRLLTPVEPIATDPANATAPALRRGGHPSAHPSPSWPLSEAHRRAGREGIARARAALDAARRRNMPADDRSSAA